MKWVETRIIFESSDTLAASDLISDIFYDFGLQGVIVESPEAEAGIDWAEQHTDQPTDYAVIGFFPKNDQLPERCRMLEQKMSQLNQNIDMTYRIVYHDIDEQDWAESWKYLRGVIRPTGHPPRPALASIGRVGASANQCIYDGPAADALAAARPEYRLRRRQ